MKESEVPRNPQQYGMNDLKSATFNTDEIKHFFGKTAVFLFPAVWRPQGIGTRLTFEAWRSA
jgi:hypothetical protein